MQTLHKPQPKTILCVDDDEDDRELINGIINELDSSMIVHNASNGEEALRFLEEAAWGKSELPCLVVLDINMPVMGGKETLQKIRAENRLGGIPIVVFTTSVNSADEAFFSSYGVKVHRKPDKFQLVVDEVKSFLKYCN